MIRQSQKFSSIQEHLNFAVVQLFLGGCQTLWATTKSRALPHPHAASTRSAPHPGEADPPSESTPTNHDRV